MMVTRRADGHLAPRAMANQKRAGGADLWFVTGGRQCQARGSRGRSAHQPVLLQRQQPEWVIGVRHRDISRDRDKIRELYAPDWKMWFAEEGDPRHGTPDDPRMVLIGVTVHAAEFLEVNKPRPVILYELVKGWVTGSEPELGEMHHLAQPRRA